MRNCEACRQREQAYRAMSASLRAAQQQMPAGVAWEKVAAEMRANIHLGLTAGRIAGGAEEKRRRFWPPDWQMAGATAAMLVVVMSGWLLQTRPAAAPDQQIATNQEIVLRASGTGLALEENGRALTLVHGETGAVLVTAGAQGSLRARYLDEDTGEVTIHHVYAK
jgi:hypothetical protein